MSVRSRGPFCAALLVPTTALLSSRPSDINQAQYVDKLDLTRLAVVGPDVSAMLASRSATLRRSVAKLASERVCSGFACTARRRSISR